MKVDYSIFKNVLLPNYDRPIVLSDIYIDTDNLQS